MKTYLISDNMDTLVGFKFAGIKGTLVHTKEEVTDLLGKLYEQKEIGIIIITEKLAALIPDQIKKLKLSKNGPLIVEVPDRHGTIKGNDSILRYVKESIGLKI